MEKSKKSSETPKFGSAASFWEEVALSGAALFWQLRSPRQRGFPCFRHKSPPPASDFGTRATRTAGDSGDTTALTNPRLAPAAAADSHLIGGIGLLCHQGRLQNPAE